MSVQPYLFFDGRCEEAVEFYRKALGAKVEMLMRFKESPDPPQENCGGGDPNKIMHSAFKVGDSLIMASDGMAAGKPEFKGFSLSISVKTVAEADKLFNALAEGGHVQMPQMKTFFSPRFGMVADRFGVGWMIIVGE